MIELKSVEQLDTLIKDQTFLLKLHTPTCGPCKALTLELIKLEQEEEVRSLGVGFYSLDVSKFPEVAARLHIMAVPTIELYHNGIMLYEITGFVLKQTTDYIRTKLLTLKTN